MSTTREQVQDLIDRGLSVRQIAAALNVSTQAVYKHLKVLGIDPPSRGKDGEAA
jgi:DNA-binding NarL/FixJ family response regulator